VSFVRWFAIGYQNLNTALCSFSDSSSHVKMKVMIKESCDWFEKANKHILRDALLQGQLCLWHIFVILRQNLSCGNVWRRSHMQP